MRHLNLTACVVLLVSSACVDLARPHAIADGGDGGVADAHVDAPDDAPAEAAPDGTEPDAPDGGGPEAGDARDGGGADAMNLHTGLIGYWKLDSNTGSMALDSSGKGNNGSIDGAPLLVMTSLPQVGFLDAAAFVFGNLNDAVRVPDSPSFRATHLTVALWVRFAGTGNHHGCGGPPGTLEYILNRPNARTTGSIDGVALVHTQDARFGFILGDNAGERTEIDGFIPGQTIATGLWYHVAGTFDGAQALLYVNGAVTSGGMSRMAPVEFGARPMFLGRSGECASEGIGVVDWEAELDGTIDDVRFYDRALGGLEIQALYNGSDF